MARVTIEDCLQNVDSKFELVLLSSHRARQLLSGFEPTIEKMNDKDPVLALKEIASCSLDMKSLRSSLIQSNRDVVKTSNLNYIDKEAIEQSILVEDIIIEDKKDDKNTDLAVEKNDIETKDESNPTIG